MRTAFRTPIRRLIKPKNTLQTCFIIRRNISFSSSKRYARSLSIVHWSMAAGVISCFALIEIKKREPKGSSKIGPLMKYHKSIGLLMMGFIGIRVGLRLITRIPQQLEAPNWMKIAANISHAGLCYDSYLLILIHYTMCNHLYIDGFMIFMPTTGILMGYYGGKGLPFFFTKIKGSETPNKTIAKYAYLSHKKVGTIFEALVVLHILGAGVHLLKGQNPLSRISPFAGAAMITIYEEFEEDEELIVLI